MYRNIMKQVLLYVGICLFLTGCDGPSSPQTQTTMAVVKFDHVKNQGLERIHVIVIEGSWDPNGLDALVLDDAGMRRRKGASAQSKLSDFINHSPYEIDQVVTVHDNDGNLVKAEVYYYMKK